MLLQTEPLFVAAGAASILAFRKRRAYSCGFLLGLLTLKPQLVVCAFLVLLVTREWRTLGAAVATGVALYAASLILLPSGCASMWLSSATADAQLSGIGVPTAIISLTGSALAGKAATLVCLAIVTVIFWTQRRQPLERLLVVALAASPLVSPHAPGYTLFIAVPLFAFLSVRYAWVVLAASFALSSADLLGIIGGDRYGLVVPVVAVVVVALCSVVLLRSDDESTQRLGTTSGHQPDNAGHQSLPPAAGWEPCASC